MSDTDTMTDRLGRMALRLTAAVLTVTIAAFAAVSNRAASRGE